MHKTGQLHNADAALKFQGARCSVPSRRKPSLPAAVEAQGIAYFGKFERLGAVAIDDFL